MSKTSTTRNTFLDYLKGVAILLVVMGHSFQCFYFDWEPMYLPIRMFHMPFFIALSAYFIKQSCVKADFSDYFKKKTVRLVLPVISWGVLSAILHGGDCPKTLI